jgi:tyrosyl-tRNA synthetase
MSIPDSEILNYLALAADVTPAELDSARAELDAKKNPRDVKAKLASRIVGLYYGARVAEEAAQEFDRVFRDGAVPEQIETVRLEAPAEGIWIVRLLQLGGLASSSSAALRYIKDGAVYLDEERVSDDQLKVLGKPEPGAEHLVRIGRKRWKRFQVLGPAL